MATLKIVYGIGNLLASLLSTMLFMQGLGEGFAALLNTPDGIKGTIIFICMLGYWAVNFYYNSRIKNEKRKQEEEQSKQDKITTRRQELELQQLEKKISKQD